MLKNLNSECLILIATFTSLLIFITPILAQQEDMMAGRIAGEQVARANTNGMAWMAVGCAGNYVGVIATYI